MQKYICKVDNVKIGSGVVLAPGPGTQDKIAEVGAQLRKGVYQLFDPLKLAKGDGIVTAQKLPRSQFDPVRDWPKPPKKAAQPEKGE